MDVAELLSYKPEQTPKRPNENDSDDEDRPDEALERAKKMRRLAQDKVDSMTRAIKSTKEPQITEEERLKILQYVDQGGDDAVDNIMDENGLKKMLLLFEKRNLRNQEMRIKFPDNPEKFMESEIDLHSMIQELKVVATVPDLYPVLVDLHAIPSLLELLAHQNTDISVAIIDLLQELSDVDILHESLEGADVLIDALVKQQAGALLIQNLDRLDETVKEESDGVHNTLSIFENLTEIRPEMCKEIAEQGLLQWILKRLKVKMPFDGNKLYCSEILSILIQSTNENRLLLGTLDGIDVLLQQLAIYKRHDPATSEEQEFMENLFNCLCSALMSKENRERFLRGEGLQLMQLMLREKKLSRNGSLKVLDHAMSGIDGRDNCNKFVDILGLRTIFPLFMKTPKRNKKRLLSSDEHEEHVVSIVASMLRNCKGAQRQRMLAKFAENDYEKVDRLIELHLKYLEKVDAVDDELEAQQRDPEMTEEEETEDNYLKRLASGLFTLQLIDYIILEICSTSETIKQRVLQILNMRGGSIKTIRHVMREYAGNLGEAGDNDWRDQENAHILQLVDRF
ncbi:beta-catenin-like protein 1 [Bradysia coprophila]|uniref:beta-catenin-like protein 1 n=1 Tax=Bradysia coprophila TaxID=38358 RepID=UPI00187DAB1E|nr:beta-catenin-like protein 1 [Bradysia coprophila]